MCDGDMGAIQLLTVHKVNGRPQFASTLFNAAFALYVSVSVYIVRRQAAAHPSSKTFYGCLHGRRAAVMRTRMEREECTMAQRRTTVKPDVALRHSSMAGRLRPQLGHRGTH